MIHIAELATMVERIDECIHYLWSKWGTEDNYNFYKDCMKHSLQPENAVPKFYFALQEESIVGCYALLRSELVARQDITPWFACLFVESEYRGNGLGAQMLDHAVEEARKAGFSKLYLSTSLEMYYEKYGWTYVSDTYDVSGHPTKVYCKFM
jgi:N-acetylglutamate synthase-like GNAT family acetyltransferase